ncbi:phosphate starvation-inducible protein PhoH [Chelatococcus asaccharovorans]|uniref:PhoH-like protein n=1 Tax=Chelatococcus asaccharovorans TaxID=28210 RepID=A0A2V3U9B4_9HYPH|nr:PhoH family protein [Chelatococcus asaccharovorans]PXW58904.1 phosphate starvation-inducible protein PhoH [Chelatococcus asaccharovorans]
MSRDVRQMPGKAFKGGDDVSQRVPRGRAVGDPLVLGSPGGSPDAGSSDTDEILVTLDDNRTASLVFGHYDQNLAHIERRLDVRATANGNHVIIKGPPDLTERVRHVMESLAQRVKAGAQITLGDVDGAIEESAQQGFLFPQDDINAEPRPSGFEQIVTRKRGSVKARNAAQDIYLRALRRHELVFAEGPAGTGKTWLAVGHAVSLLEQGLVERIVLSRPAVEAGERLGFLPGDMREKVDPYLRPVYDALYDFMEARLVERGLSTGLIEIAPLAFMRGRTLTNAAVLLDEAQNCTAMQMKMFLTRLGEGSRMIVTGDPSQIDLPPGQSSGLVEAVRLLSKVEGVGHIRFREGDVVRHELVKRIVKAYEDETARLREAGQEDRRR